MLILLDDDRQLVEDNKYDYNKFIPEEDNNEGIVPGDNENFIPDHYEQDDPNMRNGGFGNYANDLGDMGGEKDDNEQELNAGFQQDSNVAPVNVADDAPKGI